MGWTPLAHMGLAAPRRAHRLSRALIRSSTRLEYARSAQTEKQEKETIIGT